MVVTSEALGQLVIIIIIIIKTPTLTWYERKHFETT